MRETKKFTTPSGYEVEMFTYITGGESREIQGVFLSGMKFQIDETGQTKTNELNAEVTSKAQDKAIELLVIKVNGKEEDKVKTILDMPKPDFDVVAKELEAIQNGLPAEKKTK